MVFSSNVVLITKWYLIVPVLLYNTYNILSKCNTLSLTGSSTQYKDEHIIQYYVTLGPFFALLSYYQKSSTSGCINI